MSTKFSQEFKNQFYSLKTSYLISQAIIPLILLDDKHEHILKTLSESGINAGGHSFKFKEISNWILSLSEDDRRIVLREYLNYSTRSLIVPLCELFKGEKDIFSFIKNESWFVFLANMRNAFGHGVNSVWDINTYGQERVFYKRKDDGVEIILENTLNGKTMTIEDVGGRSTFIDLLVFIEGFIENN